MAQTSTTTKLATNWRWWMCVLLFVATTVNYMDRQVLSLTWKDFIAPEFHWTDNDYGTITATFSIIYAICMLFAGKFVDWMGTKKGYLWAIGVWSFGACAHALCGWLTMHIQGYETVKLMTAVQSGTTAALAIATTSVWLFIAARCILALGEAGNFPAAIKVTAEYFPKKDRAFATSIFNSGGRRTCRPCHYSLVGPIFQRSRYRRWLGNGIRYHWCTGLPLDGILGIHV